VDVASILRKLQGSAVAQAVYAGLSTESRIQFLADPFGICGRQSGTEIVFPPKDFHVSPGNISTNAVCSFVRPLPTLNTRNPSSW
jgi:hypothetical protein